MNGTDYLPNPLRAEPYDHGRSVARRASLLIACAVLLTTLIGGEVAVRANYFPSIAGESAASLDLW